MRLLVIAIMVLGTNQAHSLAASRTHLTSPRAVSSIGTKTHLNQRVVQNGVNSAGPSGIGPTGQAQPAAMVRETDTVCQTLITAAQMNGIPLGFLTRLIWQESRFHRYAVSPAGAQGVAQFMPATANGVGLADPFDVANAIAKSAELLRDLKGQFGNWGLAAAAYNAGPKRVQEWLASRRSLPAETQAYVRIVTGRTVESWVASEQDSSVPDKVSCPLLVTRLLAKSYASLSVEKPVPVTASPMSGPAWGVQLLGDASQPAVLAAYRHLQTRYPTVLGNRQPLVLRSPVGRLGSWYRVRVAANSLPEAEKLCTSLRARGGSCLVQRNY